MDLNTLTIDVRKLRHNDRMLILRLLTELLREEFDRSVPRTIENQAAMSMLQAQISTVIVTPDHRDDEPF